MLVHPWHSAMSIYLDRLGFLSLVVKLERGYEESEVIESVTSDTFP